MLLCSTELKKEMTSIGIRSCINIPVCTHLSQNNNNNLLAFFFKCFGMGCFEFNLPPHIFNEVWRQYNNGPVAVLDALVNLILDVVPRHPVPVMETHPVLGLPTLQARHQHIIHIVFILGIRKDVNSLYFLRLKIQVASLLWQLVY